MNMDEIKTKERFVAFLDIMGFKERVFSSEADELYQDFSTFKENIGNEINKIEDGTDYFGGKEEGESSSSGLMEEPIIDISQFSDSIFLYTRDSTRECLVSLTNVVKKILLFAINYERPIPLRGAIAKGKMTCDSSKNVIFGPALIDAYQLEENVIYYGIVVHHTAEADIIAYKDDYRMNKLPFRSGRINHYELVWYREHENEVKDRLKQVRLTTSESPRRYIDNTFEIIGESDTA